MKIQTVTYKSGYKLSCDHDSVTGEIETTAQVEEEETPEAAYQALRKQVRAWIRDDYAQGQKALGLDEK